MLVDMNQEGVLQRLDYARCRMADMRTLNSGDFAGAPAPDKDQLAQEFFFHLLGAVEFTVQFVNEILGLGIDPDRVTIHKVTAKLVRRTPLRTALCELYATPRSNPMPVDPYSSEGLVYRAYNYRHQVTHRGANPFFYRKRIGGSSREGTAPEVSFVLDPRENLQRRSELPLWDDMEAMYNRLSSGCKEVMRLAEQSPAPAKAMKIATLGWGSLLWEGGAEFAQQHGPWEYDGPALKLEFSRISTKRARALTLVIDEDHGTPTTVAWCLSRRSTVDDAACDLRCREGTTLENIGQIVVASAMEQVASPEAVCSLILAWARAKGLDAVIWTALGSNFKEKTGHPFAVEAAVSYMKSLNPAGKAKAAEYLWRAPGFVQTPLRSALETEPWFCKPGSQ